GRDHHPPRMRFAERAKRCDHLLGRLPSGVDRLGRARPRRSARIDLGPAQIRVCLFVVLHETILSPTRLPPPPEPVAAARRRALCPSPTATRTGRRRHPHRRDRPPPHTAAPNSTEPVIVVGCPNR